MSWNVNDASRLNAGAHQDPVQSAVSTGGTPSQPLPKIFLVAEGRAPWIQGWALAEDGTWITSHMSSSKAFARHDLQTSVKHAAYQAHYPNGYTLVDYTSDSGDELEHRGDYIGALMRGDDVPVEIKAREAAA
jgi:hypothetical protein